MDYKGFGAKKINSIKSCKLNARKEKNLLIGISLYRRSSHRIFSRIIQRNHNGKSCKLFSRQLHESKWEHERKRCKIVIKNNRKITRAFPSSKKERLQRNRLGKKKRQKF